MSSKQSPFGSMEKPEIRLPQHQRRLKQVLLSKQGAFSFYSMFSPRFIPIVVSAFALLLGVTFLLQSPEAPVFVPTASAQEAIQNSLEHLKALSPEDLLALEAKLGTPELVELFEEARSAQDLNYAPLTSISCEEAGEMANSPQTLVDLSTVVPDGSCASAATLVWKDARVLFTSSQKDLSDLVVPGQSPLGFTTSDGSAVLLILGEDFLPTTALSL